MTIHPSMPANSMRPSQLHVALFGLMLVLSVTAGCGGPGPDTSSPEKIVRSYLASMVAADEAKFDRELHERTGALRIQNAYARWRAEYDRDDYEVAAHGLEAERIRKGQLFEFDSDKDIQIVSVVVYTNSTKDRSVTRASVAATITRRELVIEDGKRTTVVHDVVTDVTAECREDAGKWYLTKIDGVD